MSHLQVRKHSEQPVSGAGPVSGDHLEEDDAPDRSKAHNINTGEPQYQEAQLRRRIGPNPQEIQPAVMHAACNMPENS